MATSTSPTATAPASVAAPTRSPKGLTALRRFAASITVFTILGHVFLGFEQAYLTPVVALLVAYVLSMMLETVDAWAQGRPVRYRGSVGTLVTFLLPAHIAGLACAMLLYGNQRLTPTIFAVSYLATSGFTLTVVLDFGTRALVGIASGAKDWFPLRGTFEVVV